MKHLPLWSTFLGTGETAENKMERVSALEELTFELGSPKKQPGKEKNKVILDSNTLYKGSRTYWGYSFG